MLGKLITFEGIDGSGKTTQINMLEDEFDKLGVAYKTYREPGGSDLSEKIRDILLDKKNIKLTSSAECLLFAAARAQLIAEQIKPAMDKGIIVICDRFVDSTTAYQGYGRGLNLKYLEKINNFATNNLYPDITFILDIDSNTAAKRLDSNSSDRMESTGIDFFNRIIYGYDKINALNSHRCIKINANRSVEDIFHDIKILIMEKFKEVLK